jgi:P27 family predicted phage terminase small subunit
MAGRKPKPTHLKIVGGSPRLRYVNENEPKPEPCRPDCPAYVSDKARSVWNEVVDMIDTLGVLTRPDALALAVLCEIYADFKQSCLELEDAGELVYTATLTTGQTVLRRHPAVDIKLATSAQIRSWLGEFGMTPSARTRVSGQAKDSKKKSKADAYFA